MSMIRIKYLPYNHIRSLSVNGRTELILNNVKNNHIVIIDGRLSSRDEAELLRRTMYTIGEEDIDKNSISFNGIEMAVLNDNSSDNINRKIAKFLTGHNNALTLIGPAKIIREIRQEPDILHIKLK